jgi:hypothetical protein
MGMGEFLKNMGVGLVIAAVLIAVVVGAFYLLSNYTTAVCLTIAGAAFLCACYGAGKSWRDARKDSAHED